MNQEKIGNFIKDIRINNNLTQKEFASILSVTPQAVSKWENGKNIPDIELLKIISSKFDIDISEILDGEYKKEEKKNYKKSIIISIIVLIVLIFIAFKVFNKPSDFEFKTITTTCTDFKISGHAAYNKDKSYISITSVETCIEDDIVYDEIKCTLNSAYKDIVTKISDCSSSNNVKLSEFLEKLKVNINQNNSICTGNMYLEIETKKSSDTNSYKIPLDLRSEC